MIMMENQIGIIKEGAYADLIILDLNKDNSNFFDGR